MSLTSRDDILVNSEPPARSLSLRTQLAAFVPITIALLGVAAILFGGMSASTTSVAERVVIDPVTTGSIGK